MNPFLSQYTTPHGSIPFDKISISDYENAILHGIEEENKEIANLMRTMFAEWIDNGHNNFDDVNTCILRIELTHGLLLSHGTRYDIDFSK